MSISHTTYYSNTDKIYERYTTINGTSILCGRYLCYRPNGKLWYMYNYRKGIRHGKNLYFHQNGTLCEKYYYHKGIVRDKYIRKYDTGEISILCYYQNNKIEGLFTEYFYTNGECTRQYSWYKNDKEVVYNTNIVYKMISAYHKKYIRRRFIEVDVHLIPVLAQIVMEYL